MIRRLLFISFFILLSGCSTMHSKIKNSETGRYYSGINHVGHGVSKNFGPNGPIGVGALFYGFIDFIYNTVDFTFSLVADTIYLPIDGAHNAYENTTSYYTKGKYPFVFASEQAQTDMLKNKNININQETPLGITALIQASASLYYTRFQKTEHQVRFLLDHGADVNYINKYGDTALALTAQRQTDRKFQNNNIKILLEYGADIAIGNNGNALKYYAKKHKNLGMMSLYYQYSEQNNSLIGAICTNNKIKVHKLIKEDKTLINRLDEVGYLPILYAAYNKNMEMVELLLEKEASLNILQNNKTLIENLAIWGTSEQIMNHILDSNLKNKVNAESGRELLLLGMKMGNFSVVKALINNGADVISPLKSKNETILMYAIKYIYKPEDNIIPNLIEAGADVNAVIPPVGSHDFYHSALTTVAAQYRWDKDYIVKVLIDNGADIHINEGTEYTPYKIAKKNYNENICKLLLLSAQ